MHWRTPRQLRSLIAKPINTNHQKEEPPLVETMIVKLSCLSPCLLV
jgi:hypothetical protein